MRRDAIQSLALDIAIDRDAEIPIGVQLAWALRTRIREGTLTPGDRLPGLRDVAEATGVNVNTVRTVYQRLEQEGLIDSQQGSGTFVATTPRHSSAVSTIAADAAREARETGVDPREVAAALYVSPGAGAGARPASEATERRRLLREQIEALERTLVELEVKHPGVAPRAAVAHPRENAGPALLNAAELEQVRAVLLRRLSTVQTAIDDIAAEKIPDTERRLEPAPASKRVPKARQTLRPAPEGA
jgi:DNA-binding transcriptional regulator YhcF (GntR family)